MGQAEAAAAGVKEEGGRGTPRTRTREEVAKDKDKSGAGKKGAAGKKKGEEEAGVPKAGEPVAMDDYQRAYQSALAATSAFTCALSPAAAAVAMDEYAKVHATRTRNPNPEPRTRTPNPPVGKYAKVPHAPHPEHLPKLRNPDPKPLTGTPGPPDSDPRAGVPEGAVGDGVDGPEGAPGQHHQPAPPRHACWRQPQPRAARPFQGRRCQGKGGRGQGGRGRRGGEGESGRGGPPGASCDVFLVGR